MMVRFVIKIIILILYIILYHNITHTCLADFKPFCRQIVNIRPFLQAVWPQIYFLIFWPFLSMYENLAEFWPYAHVLPHSGI